MCLGTVRTRLTEHSNGGFKKEVNMANFGGFYKGDKKKVKKQILDKKARVLGQKQSFVLPTIEIIKKGKNYTS